MHVLSNKKINMAQFEDWKASFHICCLGVYAWTTAHEISSIVATRLKLWSNIYVTRNVLLVNITKLAALRITPRSLHQRVIV